MRETTFPELHRLWLFFSPFAVGWMGLFCRDVCGGLNRQSGIRFALLARHHKLMSCPTLAPTELVYVCTVQVFPSSRMGIAPPPHFIFLYCTDVIPVEERGLSPPPPPPRRSGLRLGLQALSLHVAGHPKEYITLLRLMVVASSGLLLVPEGIGLMPAISMLYPFST